MENLFIPKLTLIITTKCNLRCRLCCEYIPQNKPFPDMSLDEERSILDALFATVDRVGILHLSGGGEPFLHPKLAEMVQIAMQYEKHFDRFMLFTNCMVAVSGKLFDVLKHYGERIFVQASRYGINSSMEERTIETLEKSGVALRTEKYYGENQSFGGWVDFGKWERRCRAAGELENIFRNCAVTRDMRGNWRTRDGKVHWCSRSQRGMELGLMPDCSEDYVDLFDKNETREVKREKFARISGINYLSACDYCSGDQGTSESGKRFPAAEQIGD